jgi:AraC family transcriptional regulator
MTLAHGVVGTTSFDGRSARPTSGEPGGKRYTWVETAFDASRNEQMTKTVEMGKFVGAPVHAHTSEGVSIAESTYASGLSVADHAHDAPLLSLVLQGHATEENAGHSRELSSQSLLYTPSFETHSHRFLTPGRWLNIQFSTRWIARRGVEAGMLPVASQIVRGGAAVNWASRLGTELREPDSVSPFAIEGALLLLISDLSRLRAQGERRRPRWLKVIEDAVEASIAAPPSVTELAALAGVHASHVLRTFRQYHGCTVAAYVRRQRLERARTAIATTNAPLSTIALDAGFADQSHLTRVFRQTFGVTPGQYARSLRR